MNIHKNAKLTPLGRERMVKISMTPRVSLIPTSAACSRRRSTTCIHAGVFPDQKQHSGR